MKDRVVSIMGCGWLGFPLAEALRVEDIMVKGSTTTLDKIQLMEQSGITPFFIIADPEPRGDQIENFFNSDILILNIPPSRTGGDEAIDFFIKQTECIAKLAERSKIEKVIFVSSTSVYKDEPRLMTEADAGNADRDSGKALCEAEKLLMDHFSFDTTILRMAGLYGPERHPGRFLAGKKQLPRGNAPVNLLHLDDAIGVIMAVLEQDAWGEVFNVCADQHPTRREMYTMAAERMGMDKPVFMDDYSSGKTVCNKRVKEVLGYRFHHPDPMVL